MPAPRHTHTILLVEDDDGTREAMRKLFATEGHAVICAEDGDEALTLVRREPRPCVIVLDLMMSGVSGRDFRRAQLADRAVRDIPVILLSGVHDLPEQARQLEVAIYRSKPLGMAPLLDAIDRYCERAPAVA
jgi:CheY-like chemotaxis protein